MRSQRWVGALGSRADAPSERVERQGERMARQDVRDRTRPCASVEHLSWSSLLPQLLEGSKTTTAAPGEAASFLGARPPSVPSRGGPSLVEHTETIVGERRDARKKRRWSWRQGRWWPMGGNSAWSGRSGARASQGCLVHSRLPSLVCAARRARADGRPGLRKRSDESRGDVSSSQARARHRELPSLRSTGLKPSSLIGLTLAWSPMWGRGALPDILAKCGGSHPAKGRRFDGPHRRNPPLPKGR